jgi:glycosyltransferase involved in cell wall biosynthesis
LKFIVYAVNVHRGGGAILLNALLSSINQDDVSCIAFLDRRLKLPENLTANIRVNRVAPSIFDRLSAERVLKNSVKDDDVVLCFGNLPPLFKLDAKTTILFIQNRYLIDNIGLNHFDIKSILRISLERLWLKLFCKNIDTIIVQTPSMQSCVSNHLGLNAVILPFLGIEKTYSRYNPKIADVETKRYDFIYVASGEPHKNHKQLVNAWVMLAAESIYPVLCLTLNEENNQELVKWISCQVLKYDLKIVNAGFVPESKVAELYKQARALIYPSTFESFGLPLIEARTANLAILASELDYVRDVLDPEETFEPSSPKSIARAVKRFLGCDEKALPLVNPRSFMEFCINQKNYRR